jgi:uncharacterized membrane protein
MKSASDFRSIARNALSGRWGIAVGAGLLAALLGAIPSGSSNYRSDRNDVSSGSNWELFDGEFAEILLGVAAVILAILLAVVVAHFVLGSIVRVGYSRFNLDLVDRQREPELNTLFGYFSHWRTAVAASLLKGLYIFAWSLLFFIPGIIAVYNYAMTGYILAENPHMAASDALRYSKDMMYGNRWRLFCLEISFIGWDLLKILPRAELKRIKPELIDKYMPQD